LGTIELQTTAQATAPAKPRKASQLRGFLLFAAFCGFLRLGVDEPAAPGETAETPAVRLRAPTVTVRSGRRFAALPLHLKLCPTSPLTTIRY